MFNSLLSQNPLLGSDSGGAASPNNANKQLVDALMGRQSGLKNGGMPFLPPGALPPGTITGGKGIEAIPGINGAIPALGPISLLKKLF